MDQLELLRQIYETGLIEVNGREYRLTRMRHKQRRKVFAYFTHIKDQLSDGDFGFMDSEKFDDVMATIADVTTFDGAVLSRLETHWDNYPQDYLKFVTAAMGGISYPFFSRKPYRLGVPRRSQGEDLILFTNLDDEKMTLLSLVKAGYGSLAELEALDTGDFLDLVEFESISRDIEAYYVERVHKRR